MHSAAFQSGLFLLELLRVDTGKTLAATTTPGTRNLACVTVQVGDDLAGPVAGHARAWLVRLLCDGVTLAVVVPGGGSSARSLGGPLLAIVGVTHDPSHYLPTRLPAHPGTRALVLD